MLSTATRIQPYLFFNGRCEEALEFYKQALGAQVTMLMRFKENPDPRAKDMVAPGSDEKVMHANLQVLGENIMASDGMGSGETAFKGISLSLTATDNAEADKLFNGLAQGGKIDMPLAKTFWSPYFGMVTDKFGVSWMVGLAPQA